MTFSTPPAFAADIAAREGSTGRRWLDALPGLIAGLCSDWRLDVDGPTRYGYVAVVLPVRRRDGQPAALKVTFPGADQAPEAATLAAWNGDGAVRLLDHDGGRWALLLERLDPELDLCQVPMGRAIETIGGLLRRLHRAPPPPDVPALSDTALRWTREMPLLWAQSGLAWDRRLLEEAVDHCRAAAAGAGGHALLHVDLHFANVLAADREPWLVIDPKGLVGDGAFESVAVLWNRVEEYNDRSETVARRLDAWCEAAQIERGAARAWARVRILEDALDRVTGAYGPRERDVSVHAMLLSHLGR